VNVCPAIVSVPARAAPVFAAKVNATVPLPLPLDPAVTESHAALLVAVHAHPAAAVTEICGPVPAVAGAPKLVGLMEAAHDPAWLTVKVWPAIVSVPDRGPAGLAAAEKLTWPLPLPLAPAVTVSQDALLDEVHAHPAAVVTPTWPVPPPTAIDVLVGLIADAQDPA